MVPAPLPPDEELLTAARFRVVRRHYADADGKQHAKEVILHPGAVVVMPLLDDGRLCLIRNFRPALGRVLVELPAGTRDPAELPEATAARELQEETGMTAASWERLPGFCLSPGILNEQMEVFIARGLTAGRADREPGEIIDNYLVSWDEALAMCRDGRIEDAKTLAAILRFQLTRP